MNKFRVFLVVISFLIAPIIAIAQAGEKLFIIKMNDGSQVEANSVHDDGYQINYTTTKGWPGFVSKESVIFIEEIMPKTNKPSQPIVIKLIGKPDVIKSIEKRANSTVLKLKQDVPYDRGPIVLQFMTPKQYNEAEEEWKKIAREYPDDYYAFFQLGIIAVYRRNKDHGKAILYFDEAIKRNPKASDVYLNRALSYKTFAECTAVIDNCTKLLEIQPKYSLAFKLRAECYEKDVDQRAIMTPL